MRIEAHAHAHHDGQEDDSPTGRSAASASRPPSTCSRVGFGTAWTTLCGHGRTTRRAQGMVLGAQSRHRARALLHRPRQRSRSGLRQRAPARARAARADRLVTRTSGRDRPGRCWGDLRKDRETWRLGDLKSWRLGDLKAADGSSGHQFFNSSAFPACSPHSFLVSSSHHQRPARSCCPGLVGRVQGSQPIEMKPRSCSSL